ncbi:MAG: NUDIX domain-containing protein [Asgard group archaeon]|nr:NUDIX domain-containing protein [Asgard group archaeon]
MKQFYVAVGAAIEKDGKILVLRRSPEKDFGANYWEIITGRLEEEEHPEIGTLREVEEEVGLKAEVIMPVYSSFFYRGGKEFPMVFIVYWCKYLEGEVKISWEHTEYKWLSLDEAINEPKLKLFSGVFKNIKKLKEHVPIDFKL